MKKMLLPVLILATVNAHAVVGPAYQNLLKMNAAVEAVVKFVDPTGLINEAQIDENVDKLEISNIAVQRANDGSGDSVTLTTKNLECQVSLQINAPAPGQMVGGGTEYSTSDLSCSHVAIANRTLAWEKIEAKITKAAGRGKTTVSAQVKGKSAVTLEYQK